METHKCVRCSVTKTVLNMFQIDDVWYCRMCSSITTVYEHVIYQNAPLRDSENPYKRKRRSDAKSD